MKRFLACAAFLAFSTTVNAQTYHVEGFTIHVPRNCSSSSCVSLNTPGYGNYYGGKRIRSTKHTKVESAKVAIKTEKGEGTDASSKFTGSSPVPFPITSAPSTTEMDPAVK